MKALENILHSTSNITAVKTSIISVFYANSCIKEQLLAALKPYDLSIEQFNVLRILRGQKGQAINLQDVQQRMINKMSNTTRLIDKLLKKNFVERSICENNRRKIEITITDLGLEKLKLLDPKIDAVEQQITKDLTQTELKQLNNLLLKLNN